MPLPSLPTPDLSSAIYFCNRVDIETLWSAAEVLSSVDDDSSGTLSAGEEALIDDAIVRAAQRMMAYLGLRYTAASLVGNSWCRQTNAALAAYLLATRRGDPAPSQLAELNSLAISDLQSIRSGALSLPGAAEQLGQLPTLTNFTPVLGRDPIIARRNDLSW